MVDIFSKPKAPAFAAMPSKAYQVGFVASRMAAATAMPVPLDETEGGMPQASCCRAILPLKLWSRPLQAGCECT
eukprot:1148236-Pelagomonas_calceolata.AAC.2